MHQLEGKKKKAWKEVENQKIWSLIRSNSENIGITILRINLDIFMQVIQSWDCGLDECLGFVSWNIKSYPFLLSVCVCVCACLFFLFILSTALQLNVFA